MTDTPTATADGPAASIDLSTDTAALARHVEAVLMTIDRPMNAGKIADVLELDTPKPVVDAIKQLNDAYEQTGRAFRIEQVAGGYQVLTQPQYRQPLARLHKAKVEAKLSPAAMETLAIIAYRQPVLRADIESIRGVASGEVIRSLMDRNLVKIAGRADEIGRPMLYGTTKRFLEVFGLSSIKELPKAEELVKP